MTKRRVLGWATFPLDDEAFDRAVVDAARGPGFAGKDSRDMHAFAIAALREDRRTLREERDRLLAVCKDWRRHLKDAHHVLCDHDVPEVEPFI